MVGSGYIYVSVWSIKLWLDQDIYIYVSVWSIELWLVGSKYISKVGVLNYGWLEQSTYLRLEWLVGTKYISKVGVVGWIKVHI